MQSHSEIVLPVAVGERYSPHPLVDDPESLSLKTSRIRTSLGPVTVRHGRRAGPAATILLHGAAGSWTTWTPFIRAADLAGAQPLADLIVPDFPGWGDSPAPDDDAAAGIESLAAAVAQIARTLGYERWRVVGHSLGGFVALELAASQPDRTTEVGLVSATTYSVIDSAAHPLTRFGALPGFTALLGVMRILAKLPTGGLGLINATHRLGLLRALVAPLFGTPTRIDPSVVAALATETRPRSFALAADRAARYDADGSWARILCPVRSVHGDRDVFVAVEDDQRLHARLAHFTVTVLAGTGHFAHIERPEATVRNIWPTGAGTRPRGFPFSLAL
jgi:pimeloyl-ACP methyl ester carboxylesterase